MNMVQDIKPISYVKAHAADLISQINVTHRPLIVTQNGEATAVLVDTTTFQNLQESLKILKLLSHSEKEAQKGNKTLQSEFFARMDKKFK